MRYNFAVLFFGMYLMLTSVVANNIQVGNIAIVEQNTTAKQSLVQFDLTWENSWRTSNLNGAGVTNWDAAWIFVKFRVGSGDWQHAKLDANGHQTGTGTSATIDAGLLDPKTAFNATTNPAVGVFVYRQSDGTGTFTQDALRVVWNYGENGVADDATVDIKVFAIEMVYVPQGAFYVGSGGTEVGSFTDGSWAGIENPTIPFVVDNELSISIEPNPGKLWGTSQLGASTIGSTGTLSADFPKGFQAFYSMKYEMTQKLYVDFLNTLNRAQQNTRTARDLAPGITSVFPSLVMIGIASGDVQARNGISCTPTVHATDPIVFFCDLNGNGIPNETNDGQTIPCNWISSMDGEAFADWAGLRPMTELEYEKACRGTIPPFISEFPWGTDRISGNPHTITNSFAYNEEIETGYYVPTPTAPIGNAKYSLSLPIQGPLRVGIFASNINNNGRIAAGATFYGIMEMGGNLWERPVTVGNEAGRIFSGMHGDGILSSNGAANQFNWPGLTGGEVTGAEGIGFRGGAWNLTSSYMRLSNRIVNSAVEVKRGSNHGFRAVRSHP